MFHKNIQNHYGEFVAVHSYSSLRLGGSINLDINPMANNAGVPQKNVYKNLHLNTMPELNGS